MHVDLTLAIGGAILLVALVIFIARRRTLVSLSPDRSELLTLQSRWQGSAEWLTRPVPRATRFTAEGKAALAHALLTLSTGIGLGGVITWLAIRDAVLYRILEREGVTTTAQIIEKREKQEWGVRPGKTTLRYVTFSYAAGGRTYRGEAGLPLGIYRRIQPGDSMPVRYRASNPEQKRLLVEGEEGSGAAMGLAALAVFGCALALILAWLEVRPALVQKRALAWGQPAAAMVVRLSPKKNGTKVIYQFLDRAGNVVQGSVRINRPRIFMLRQVVTVLYEEETPRRNTVYPAPLAQIDS